MRDGVAAMRDACTLPVTVKHRIGIDKIESYDFVRDFVGTVAAGGCTVFIVHARNAWLQGLSPKDNRTIPPLRYEFVYRAEAGLPGLHDRAQRRRRRATRRSRAHLAHVDGVMIGREAYHDPWCMSDWDARFLGGPALERTRESVEAQMVDVPRAAAGARAPLVAGVAPHAGAVERRQGRAPLAPGVVGSALKTSAPAEVVAPRRAGARRCGHDRRRGRPGGQHDAGERERERDAPARS